MKRVPAVYAAIGLAMPLVIGLAPATAMAQAYDPSLPVQMRAGQLERNLNQELQQQQQQENVEGANADAYAEAQGHMTISQEQAPQQYYNTFPQLLCRTCE